MADGNPAGDNKQATNTDNPEQDAAYWKKHFEIAEQRRRDTQASYTKGQQKLKELEAQQKAMEEFIPQVAKVELTSEQLAELDDLRFTDPDAYFNKRLQMETQAKAKLESAHKQLKEKATQTAQEEYSAEARKQMETETKPAIKLRRKKLYLPI